MKTKETLNKLLKINTMIKLVDQRVISCEKFIESQFGKPEVEKAFQMQINQAKRYIANADKLKNKIRVLFQWTLVSILDLKLIEDKDILTGILDEIDGEMIWDYQFGEIEHYAENVKYAKKGE